MSPSLICCCRMLVGSISTISICGVNAVSLSGWLLLLVAIVDCRMRLQLKIIVTATKQPFAYIASFLRHISSGSLQMILTARCYALHSMDCVSQDVCLSVIPSVTRRYCSGASFEPLLGGRSRDAEDVEQNRGTEGASASMRWDLRRGVHLSSGSGALGSGLCPLEKFLRFLYGNNAFWCILK